MFSCRTSPERQRRAGQRPSLALRAGSIVTKPLPRRTRCRPLAPRAETPRERLVLPRDRSCPAKEAPMRRPARHAIGLLLTLLLATLAAAQTPAQKQATKEVGDL